VDTKDGGSDFFVLLPAETPAAREDRPPTRLSVARLALAIAVTTALMVLLTMAIGFLVKLQLDRYFTSGG
jgi:hypothetical protein